MSRGKLARVAARTRKGPPTTHLTTLGARGRLGQQLPKLGSLKTAHSTTFGTAQSSQCHARAGLHSGLMQGRPHGVAPCWGLIARAYACPGQVRRKAAVGSKLDFAQRWKAVVPRTESSVAELPVSDRPASRASGSSQILTSQFHVKHNDWIGLTYLTRL
jgi:hypothetical protein